MIAAANHTRQTEAACQALLSQQAQHCKELQDTQISKTMQQNAALTWLDGAPAMNKLPCASTLKAVFITFRN
jgi:hypothetical protein